MALRPPTPPTCKFCASTHQPTKKLLHAESQQESRLSKFLEKSKIRNRFPRNYEYFLSSDHSVRFLSRNCAKVLQDIYCKRKIARFRLRVTCNCSLSIVLQQRYCFSKLSQRAAIFSTVLFRSKTTSMPNSWHSTKFYL